MTTTLTRALAGLLAMSAPALAPAYEQPAVNLGFTSFLDGGPPAGSGWYFQSYLQFYSADDFTGPDGRHLFPDPQPEVDATVLLTQLIYQSEWPLFGGQLGLDVILPYVDFDLEPGASPLSANSGPGDIVVGPYVQWKPVMGEKGPVFMQRVELQILVPSGDYSDRHLINAGSNFISFNPYWSGTVFFGPRWSASLRLHLLFNERNTDPAVVTGLNSFKAGSAVHGNYAVSFDLLPQRLRVGVNGYFFEQISDTEADHTEMSSLNEKIFAVGPGAVYSFSREDHVILNAHFESSAENRTEGTRMILRWAHHF